MQRVDDFTVEATPGGTWLSDFKDHGQRMFIPAGTVPALVRALVGEATRLEREEAESYGFQAFCERRKNRG